MNRAQVGDGNDKRQAIILENSLALMKSCKTSENVVNKESKDLKGKLWVQIFAQMISFRDPGS